MTSEEFSNQFDVLYNNITSNQAPGLNEYEKSVFLTKAQSEIVKNYFTANSKGNNIGQGFDDSAKRQADFSMLMKTAACIPVDTSSASTVTVRKQMCTESGSGNTTILYNSLIGYVDGILKSFNIGSYTITNGKYSGHTVIGFPYNSGTLAITETEITVEGSKIDPRSLTYAFPDDTFIVVNETIINTEGNYLQVIPLRYDEYTRLMSKPFKYPVKNQAWRLLNSSGGAVRIAEIIIHLNEAIAGYNIRYVREPHPIIVSALGDLTVGGLSDVTECELDPILHEDILQRAVELAKVAWTATGQDNYQAVIQAGQRSE